MALTQEGFGSKTTVDDEKDIRVRHVEKSHDIWKESSRVAMLAISLIQCSNAQSSVFILLKTMSSIIKHKQCVLVVVFMDEIGNLLIEGGCRPLGRNLERI